jgi:response regulator RpfG family c-di-GMP phosphodiesterase
MVVANDLKLLKLLDMALKLELACEVLTFASGRSAGEAAKSVKPALLIIVDQLLDRSARVLADRLHSIKGLERVPTLLINTFVPPRRERRSYHTIFLCMPWRVEELYAAVYELLGSNS